jgi:hypothetical protein
MKLNISEFSEEQKELVLTYYQKMIKFMYINLHTKFTLKINLVQMIKSSVFHTLGLVACYGHMSVSKGSSQRPLSFLLVMENMKWYS